MLPPLWIIALWFVGLFAVVMTAFWLHERKLRRFYQEAYEILWTKQIHVGGLFKRDVQ